MCIKEQNLSLCCRANLHLRSLCLVPVSAGSPVPAWPPRAVCVCLQKDQMRSARQSVTAGRSATLSSHHGPRAHARARAGSHRGTAVPTHTDQNQAFVRKESSFMGHTRRGVGGLSPRPCSGWPNYPSAPRCPPHFSLCLSLISFLFLQSRKLLC